MTRANLETLTLMDLHRRFDTFHTFSCTELINQIQCSARGKCAIWILRRFFSYFPDKRTLAGVACACCARRDTILSCMFLSPCQRPSMADDELFPAI